MSPMTPAEQMLYDLAVKAGWCEAKGIKHTWQVQDYELPPPLPPSVRKCATCGKTEPFRLTN